jgi:CDP-diacylglycerol--serine O-phosphatidyltransferase
MRPRIPRKRKEGAGLRRGIYLIPSLFTVANIFCGFWSLIASSHGRFSLAALLILMAIVADVLDGRIARLTGTTSSFGEAYDSLADVISFGAAPAFLAYTWGLRLQPDFGLFFCFLFLVAGSIRLARFNTRAQDPNNFSGLPIPAGAGGIAMLVLVSPTPVSHPWFIPVVMAFVLALSVLMVSNLPYRSFKDLNLRKQWPALALFFMAVVFSVIVYSLVTLRPHLLAILAACYIMSAPVTVLWRRVRRAPAGAPVDATGLPGQGTTDGSDESEAPAH